LRQNLETSPEQRCCSEGLPLLAKLSDAHMLQRKKAARVQRKANFNIIDLKLNPGA